MWAEVSQPARRGAASAAIELALRPTRMFAHFMLVGSVGFAIAAIWLLAHSGAGIVVLAEGRPGTAITMPTPSADGLVIYGVPDPDQGQTRSDVICKLETTSSAWVGSNHYTPNATSKGRMLIPVADVNSGWNDGDTLTCAAAGYQSLVLGRNVGLTYLLQGLLCAFAAFGSGIIALIGFASRRHRARAMAVQGA